MNPAFALALLILGKIDGGTFGVTIAGEFLGAFVGAILVWLHFLPHFKTVPAPPSLTPDDDLLKSNDALTASALGIASFNPHEEDIAARQRGIRDLTNIMEDIKYYLKDTYKATHPLDKHSELMEVALGPEALKGATNLRRHSVQVRDVHRRLKDMELQSYENMLLNSSRYPLNRLYSDRTVAGQTADASNTHQSELGNNVIQNDSRLQQRREHLDRLYDAALVADQNAKLSIFATRPATYSPAFNFLCELLSTLALTYGALMISERGGQLYGPERMTFEATGTCSNQ